MEEYKSYLFSNICDCRNTTIEEVEKRICRCSEFTINRNEEGKIHSRYFGDQYEPAIIWKNFKFTYNYYLFDGDIKDCEHPFLITYYNEEIVNIIYHSSERIRNGEPNIINNFYTHYNNYRENIKILDGYESKRVEEIKIIEDVTLCDEMDIFTFKFAD